MTDKKEYVLWRGGKLFPSYILGEAGRGLRLQRERRQFTGSWEEQVFGRHVFVMPCRDSMIQRGNLNLALLGFP